MNDIVQTIKQEKQVYISTILMMALFTFLFLGIEYLFVDMISLLTSSKQSVWAQNCMLGMSSLGFLLFPIYNRIFKQKHEKIKIIFFSLITIICIFVIYNHLSYQITFIAGLILFLTLGFLGSVTFYKAANILQNSQYLARFVGVSYMIGIIFQFLNNNLVSSRIVEVCILSIVMFIFMIILNNQKTQAFNQYNEKHDSNIRSVMISLILLIILMSCVFSTLDNAVTLVHASGVVDIGQLPRILLALSGLIAGIIFDFQNRKFMCPVMYCMMLLSTLCIIILKFSEPFLIGLIIFYMTAGFFVVFFTTSFMELSYYTYYPDLWAGLGRALNNMTAALFTTYSLKIVSLHTDIKMTIYIVLLFVLISMITFVYIYQRNKMTERITSVNKERSKEERLALIQNEFSFTPRETEVFDCLVSCEDSIQMIADHLYISKRTLERYISSIYKKTGVKSRIGLINIYNQKT